MTIIEKNYKLEYGTIIKYLYLKMLRGKQNEDIFNTLGDECSPYATVKKWISRFKRINYPLKRRDRDGKFLSTHENIDAVQSVE